VPAALVLPALLGAVFLIIPLVGLVARAPWGTAFTELRAPETIDALRLSMVASLSATALALVMGVPLAWMYARVEFPGRSLLRALTTLPMVLPPVVGGLALLLAFGRRGLLGAWLEHTFGRPGETGGGYAAGACRSGAVQVSPGNFRPP